MAHVRVDVGTRAVLAVPRDEAREVRTGRGRTRSAARWPAREWPTAVAAAEAPTSTCTASTAPEKASLISALGTELLLDRYVVRLEDLSALRLRQHALPSEPEHIRRLYLTFVGCAYNTELLLLALPLEYCRGIGGVRKHWTRRRGIRSMSPQPLTAHVVPLARTLSLRRGRRMGRTRSPSASSRSRRTSATSKCAGTSLFSWNFGCTHTASACTRRSHTHSFVANKVVRYTLARGNE